MGCASADLLHEAHEEDVIALATAGVRASCAPAPPWGWRMPPVRALLDKGVAVATRLRPCAGRQRHHLHALVISLAIATSG